MGTVTRRGVLGLAGGAAIAALPGRIGASRGTPPVLVTPPRHGNPPVIPATPPPGRGTPPSFAHPALFYGESITEYGAYPGVICDRRGWTRINQTPRDPHRAAISGSALEATGLTDAWLRIGKWDARELVIMYGATDFYAQCAVPSAYTLARWQAAMPDLLTQYGVRPQGNTRITIIGLPYMTGRLLEPSGWAQFTPPPWATDFADARRQMDATLVAGAAHRARFVSLDAMTAAMIDANGIHPTAAGQALIADALLGVLT